ncbi:MAG: histidinol dehydrogenase [Acidobacteria bacterium]|nr:MAG: histidinol dehydrogenase [Acidobacteria bacterium 13_1_40CM_56_16]OLD70638.1 MAG: histidinol dehydrogenase [Acidobacteria bacterium 13_1_40CM_2_56_11]PYR69120.1 MAG: histidinol dehydrogenase [Acidobacteriota bacterium]
MRIVDLSAELNLNEVESLLASDDFQQNIENTVHEIIEDVRRRGDEALCDYTKRFDEFDLTPESMRVYEEDIHRYASDADDELVEILQQAAKNIREFHNQQVEDSWEYYAGDGIRLGVRQTPIQRAGIYIPGGKAAYPSSVLMNVIPAQVAGVERIVAVTPPRALEENPLVAAALKLLNLNEAYRIGGAQAIAALAYGTQTVPQVHKIVGPGNPYVQSAKRHVYGVVDIDMVAGPSEVAIVADETCDPAWIAADLLAQAEHDEMAGVWLICWSRELAASVFDEVQVQLDLLDRNDIARVAVIDRGIIFIVQSEDDAIAIVNHIAPEHVEVLMAEPDHVSDNIKNAGAVFIGRYAPTVVGDYFAGPSHVLPTNRTARFFSPLGVPDFVKRTSVIRYSGRAIERFGEMIEKFAIAEGLTGHAKSITIRRHKA